MVGPTVRVFRDSSARVALSATPATIQSGIYQNAFTMIGKDVEYIAIDGLAGAIEFGESEGKIESIIRTALSHTDFDVLILACTHYPLVMDVFKRVLGEKVAVFDPALAVAERVEAQLWPREVGDGRSQFAITQDSPHFRGLVERLFPGSKYEIEVLE